MAGKEVYNCQQDAQILWRWRLSFVCAVTSENLVTTHMPRFSFSFLFLQSTGMQVEIRQHTAYVRLSDQCVMHREFHVARLFQKKIYIFAFACCGRWSFTADSIRHLWLAKHLLAVSTAVLPSQKRGQLVQLNLMFIFSARLGGHVSHGISPSATAKCHA